MNRDNGFVEHTLANGLRVVIEPMPQVQSAAGGFLVQTGSRDETPEFAGVSHFLEHMCFKGTAKRGWEAITVDFDNMGSTYNAYTSKERTVYFGWVRVDDLERQVDLLVDMMQSIVPPEEFEMEKKVILEEIAMSDDSIERKVYDLIHETFYGGHSLSWPVLGTTDTVGAMTRDQLFDYFQSRYHPANMVLIVAGAVNPDDVIAMAERTCGEWRPKSPRPDRSAPPSAKQAVGKRVTDRFQQQAIGLVYPAPSATHPDRENGDVLAAVLGGQNSRFFWNIIQAGIAPHVAAGRLDYCDDGMMIAFGFAEPAKVEAVLEAMRKEIDKVSKNGVVEEEVQRVKNRAQTALATESEAPYYRLMQMIHDVDVLGRPRSVTERLAAVDAVTPATIRAYLEAWPLRSDGLVSLGPRDWPNDD
ncbi:MAG: insulinase family protein [Phycisphaerales bacterium]|nr:insulinase family protein [Phycisphaerales bacterium]